MAYSEDLRIRVMSAVDGGMSKAEAAEHFGVSRAIVFVWMKTPEKTTPEKTGPKGSWRLDLAALKDCLSARPDSYQHELAEALGVTQPTICEALKTLKLTRKKNETISRKKRRLSERIS